MFTFNILSIHLTEVTLRLNPMLTYVTAMSYAKITQTSEQRTIVCCANVNPTKEVRDRQTSAQRAAWHPDSHRHNEGAVPTSKVNKTTNLKPAAVQIMSYTPLQHAQLSFVLRKLLHSCSTL